jgi:hypothetical protein
VWIANDQGDITGITATSPLTGGGTSGAVTVGIQDGTTAQKGAVQLENSTSSTSTTTAAVPAAVKSAYDLADGAIAKTTVTTAGDIIYRNATVPTRLPIGTANQVLRVNSGATAPEWATVSSTPTFVGCSLFSTNPTITNATNTTLTWSGENYDTDGFHSTVSNTSRITIPAGKAGKYLFTYNHMWEGTNGNFANRIFFYKNGAQHKYLQLKYLQDNDVSTHASLVMDLAVSDYVEIVVWQNHTGSRLLYIDNTYGYFQASYLGA